MSLLLQGVQHSCEVWAVLFGYSIFTTNVRDLQSLVPRDYPTLSEAPLQTIKGAPIAISKLVIGIIRGHMQKFG